MNKRTLSKFIFGHDLKGDVRYIIDSFTEETQDNGHNNGHVRYYDIKMILSIIRLNTKVRYSNSETYSDLT